MSTAIDAISEVINLAVKHADIIALAIEAAETKGVDHNRLREAIKREMTEASDAMMREALRP